MSKTPDSNVPSTAETPAFLALPPELEGATTQELADRYTRLSEIKIAGETRAGRHPSGFNRAADVEPDPAVREVLDAGLNAIVREMAAVMHELNNRPAGLTALLP